MYAAFDPERMGTDIAWHLRRKGLRRIGIFTEPAAFPDTALFLNGFRTVCADETSVLDCPNHQVDLRAFELFEEDEPFDAIVCTDQRRESAVRAACAYASRRPLPLIVSAAPRSAVTDPLALAYELDYKRLAHRIVKALLARLETRSPPAADPFYGEQWFSKSDAGAAVDGIKPADAHDGVPFHHSVETPAAASGKSTGIHLELTVLPSLRDVYEVIQSSGSGRYDLIRMDVAWMDELAKKLFRPLHQIPLTGTVCWRRRCRSSETAIPPSTESASASPTIPAHSLCFTGGICFATPPTSECILKPTGGNWRFQRALKTTIDCRLFHPQPQSGFPCAVWYDGSHRQRGGKPQ